MRRNAVGTDSEPQASPDALERLLLWARANGVKGVGGAGDKLALFETDDGDRGLVATEDISYGEVVLQVPLRIAITDHDAPEPYEGAPWSVRLACRILRERGDPSSPFKPYIDSLPSVVPGPVTTWSWDDVQSIQYPPVLNEIYETNFLIMDAFRNVGSSPDPVLSSIEFDDFMWAMSCVHSRTFGLPAKTGPGIGVRVMVPVVDMLNHAAAELDVMPSANWRAKDNLRWEVRSPERSDSDEWMFVVECIRPCAAQEEIFLSYGQRASDDFLVHYGFFPDSNANEATLLFESLEDAVTWAAENAPRVSEVQTAEDTPALLSRARTAAGAVQKALAKEGGDVPDKIDLQTRARMDYRAVVAFAAAVDTSWDIRVNPQEDWAWSGVLDVPPAAQAAASELGALRAIEVLEGMPSTLVEDLQVLAKAEQEQNLEGPWAQRLSFYEQEILSYAGDGGVLPVLKQDTHSEPGAIVDAGAPVDAGAVVDAGQVADVGRTFQALLDASEVTSDRAHLLTAYAFRAWKKMLCWDLVLRSGPRGRPSGDSA